VDAAFLMKKDILRRDMYYGASISTIRSASILRKNTTLAEKVLWKRLRDRNHFKVKFRRQHPLDMFIVDFYCHELGLVVEVDGEIHNLKENLEYDISRQSHLEYLGLTVIRFTNHEVIFGLDTVFTRISGIVTELTPQ
jgi:very-short-patch-repair endonuclease